MIDFVNITFIDVLDILLVALLIYEFFRLIRGTSAMSIFIGILLLYVLWIVVRALDMKLLSTILGQVLGVGVIAMIVIFQQEIRQFLLHFGNRYILGRKKLKSRTRRRAWFNNEMAISADVLEEITAACQYLSETHTGALIVFKHQTSLDSLIETGDRIDAAVHRRLIENLFFKNSPLHDGAIIMTQNRILAARCILPLTNRTDINPKYGMRHRAAIGVSEITDAEVVVVSEETGDISYVADGNITTMQSIAELRLTLENSYNK